MPNADPTPPSQKDVEEFIDNLPHDQPFEIEWADNLCTKLQHFGDDSQVSLVIRFLKRFEDKLDWGQFRKREREAGRISDDELNEWERSEKNWNDHIKSLLSSREISDERPGQSTNDESDVPFASSEKKAELRIFEQSYIANFDVIYDVLSPISKSFDLEETLKDLLPSGLLPISYQTICEDRYDHNLHLAARNLLDLLGPESRSSEQIAWAFGSIVARQYPSEDVDEYSCYTFDECRSKAVAYVSSHLTDGLALLWLGELASWDADENITRKCARQFWEESRAFDIKTSTQVLQLFDKTSFLLGRTVGWKGDEPSAEWLWLMMLEDEWDSGPEPLLAAFVRRTIATHGVDTAFLDAFGKLLYREDLEDDERVTNIDLPSSAWIWIAENQAPSAWQYYDAWEQAFITSLHERHPDTSWLTCGVMLCGYIRGEHKHIPFEIILKRMMQMHANGTHVSPIERAFYQLDDSINTEEVTQLTAKDGIAFQKSFAYIDGPALPLKLNNKQYVTLLRQWNDSARSKAISYWRSELGSDLWERLAPRTKDLLLDGRSSYDQKTQIEGDGEYGNPLLNLQAALLVEVKQRFWQPILKNRDAKRELYDPANGILSEEKDTKEWRPLRQVLTKSAAISSVMKLAVLNGIRLDLLENYQDDLDWIRKDIRNHASHLNKIDREHAAVLYDKLVHQGLLRRILSAMHRGI